MEIPLPTMMRRWRERDFVRGNPPLTQRLALKLWALPRSARASITRLPARSPAAGAARRPRGAVPAARPSRGLDEHRDLAGPTRQDVPGALRPHAEAASRR